MMKLLISISIILAMATADDVIVDNPEYSTANTPQRGEREIYFDHHSTNDKCYQNKEKDGINTETLMNMEHFHNVNSFHSEERQVNIKSNLDYLEMITTLEKMKSSSNISDYEATEFVDCVTNKYHSENDDNEMMPVEKLESTTGSTTSSKTAIIEKITHANTESEDPELQLYMETVDTDWAVEEQRIILVFCGVLKGWDFKIMNQPFPIKEQFEEYFARFGRSKVSAVYMDQVKTTACVAMEDQYDYNEVLLDRAPIIGESSCRLLLCPGCKHKTCIF